MLTSDFKVVDAIEKRRLDWDSTSSDPHGEYKHAKTPAKPKEKVTETSRRQETSDNAREQKMAKPPRGASSDPVRLQMVEKIESLKEYYLVS